MLVASDILRRMLHKTRPYEITPGETDRVYEECLNDLSSVIAKKEVTGKEKLEAMIADFKKD